METTTSRVETEVSEETPEKSTSEGDRSWSPAEAVQLLTKSSSSSSLLLPENKKDSPTKASRLQRSASSGSITKRNSASSPVQLQKSTSSSSLVVPENQKDTPTKSKQQQEKRPSADAATILESLASAEKEQLKSNPTSPQQSVSDTTTKQEELELIVNSPKETPSPTKKVVKIPENKKDSPRTPDGEKRAPRSSPILAQDIMPSPERVTLERLERITASPVSVDSMNANEAKDWLTEPTSSQETDTEQESSPQQKPSTTSTSEQQQSSDTVKDESASSPNVSLPRRTTSLQWHEASTTSSRVLTAPQPPEPKPRGLLPSPPSMVKRTDEVVAVFNANTSEGKSMVRALAKHGSRVVAIVRVFTSRNTKSLLKLGKNVVVKVADSHDEAALAKAVEGAHRAFLVTTYWERFDSALEEKQAFIVLNACASQNVRHLVLSSFEDTRMLKEKGLKSQIVPRRDGTITPKFEGMAALKEAARERNVQLIHMITSYLDQEHSKKSLCLIVGENGNLLINSHFPEED